MSTQPQPPAAFAACAPGDPVTPDAVHLRVRVHASAEALAEDTARYLVQWCAEAVAQRGVFTLALSGGETPRLLFALLAQPEWQARMNWPRTQVFWVDERCVPATHPRSNYGVARQVLFDHVAAQGVFPMNGASDPGLAAKAYAHTLSEQLGNPLSPLDCVLLGMGEDGHTASLFPDATALDAQIEQNGQNGPVAAVYVNALQENRLTLTLPVLNAARRCVFLVCGANKHDSLRAALNVMAPPLLPVQRIRPQGELIYMLDTTAWGSISK